MLKWLTEHLLGAQALNLRRLLARVRHNLADAVVNLGEHMLLHTEYHQVALGLLLDGVVHLLLGEKEPSLMEELKQSLGVEQVALGRVVEHDPLEETDGLLQQRLVLVQLPEGTDSVAFNNFCQETDKKVMFLPGASFGASYGNFLRLSFSYYDAADMAVGAERLGKAITAFLSQ